MNEASRRLFGAASLVILAGSALAQTLDQPPKPSPNDQSVPKVPASGGELKQIVVTGYVIPRLGEDTQPVFTLDRPWWEKRGQQNVAEILETLPFSGGNFNQTLGPGNNTSPAGDAVNLRNLGVNTTLILVDGLRFPLFPLPLAFTQTFVDLNSIPISAIDRIEILKDSGSATYGADAVAGVINIILKDSYQGFGSSNYIGFSQRGDAVTYHAQLVGGLTDDLGRFGKFNAVAAFNYEVSTPISASDRSFTTTDYNRLSPRYPSPPIWIVPYLSSFLGVNTGNFYTVPRGANNTPVTLLRGGETDPILIPQNSQLQPREERWGGLIKLNYSPTGWLKVYDTFIIEDNHETASTLNQGYDVGGSDKIFGQDIIVPARNPFNTTGEPLIPQGGWGGDFPAWIADTWIRTFRNTLGAQILLPYNWIVESLFNYGESDATWTVHNSVDLLNLQEALNGSLPGHVGQFYNPFLDWRAVQGFNGALPSAILTDQTLDSRTDLLQWVLKAGGTVLDLYSGPLNVAAGLEYRSESLIEANDRLSELRLIALGNFVGKQTNGRRYIKSGYLEVDLPLAGAKFTVPGLRALDFTYSERCDDYSLFGSAAKPKFAIRYRPFNDLTLRASYSESFVAPSLSQLFATPLQFQDGINDPNFPATDPRHVYSTIVVQGSNPKLKPEEAYSYYLEAVWSPDSLDDRASWLHFLHGLTVYVDWFQIELRDQIGSIPFQFVVDAPTAFPGNAVIRSPATGQVLRVENPFTNVGSLNTRGLDWGLSYISKEYNWGKIDFELNATYVYGHSEKIPYPPVGGQSRFQVITMDDQAGLGSVGFGGGPDFKLVASLFYSKTICGIDTFSIGATLNYRDSEGDFNNNSKGSNPLANSSLDAPGYVHLIGSWTTLDCQLSYEFGDFEELGPATVRPGYDKEGKRVAGEPAILPRLDGSRRAWRSLLNNSKVTFGIKNVFDTRPPLSVDSPWVGRDFFNDNSVQRYFYFEVDKRF